ncbi:unnamed protein product [Tilletia controversa]|uniref:Carrier domain-containing protein n=3 Tax=Tilletia TaxID=13289 RepID=A0A8X7SWU6_9BASI|nr:hypothetical protein CF336_g6430 [Tilletia laevis]KAE8190719.1 hypothetical protein CF328_g5889 [Tilletia controversa]KAE8254776.1 hypothetical protein A4X03_0g5667 [Tilletia caries]KAE8193340.1 hypothetical protein CF335_g5617 [Tilletia laevis]KAE8247178.1 hypothetical protein A4X06_0g4643 [Tilletia controversa]
MTWTYAEIDRVSKRTARVLRNDIEISIRKGQDASMQADKSGQRDKATPIAILGPSGPEFLAHILACWHLGLAIIPIATGTAAPGIANLLKLTGCNAIIAHKTEQDLAKEAITLLPTQSFATLIDWRATEDADGDSEGTLSTPRHDKVAPLKAFREVHPQSELVIFHSSGSTGNPKPIPQLHRFWTKSLTTAHGADLAAFTTTPLFHGGLSDLFRALQAGAPIFFFPWHEAKPPTTSNILVSVRECSEPIHYFLSVPFLLEVLLQDPDGIHMLQRMQLVSTGGAPLPEEMGNVMVHQHDIRLVSRLGSSECGFLMSSWRDFTSDKEWSWLRVDDEASVQWLDFQERPEEGALYELIVKEEWPTKIVSNRPGGSYATSDLYERHPRHPQLWRYSRRADDSLVLVNGKKVASSPIEAALKATDFLSDAIVFGANRPFLGAIVLPTDSLKETDERTILQKLELVLQKINKSQPNHAYLGQDMICVGSAQLFASLPRSSKGTLQRGIALDRLAATIDAVYSRFERGDASSVNPRARLQGAQLRELVHEVVRNILGQEIQDSADFFAAGVDSIKAMRIRATLLSRLDLGGRALSNNILYEHANIRSLCDFLDDPECHTGGKPDVAKIAQDLIERYSSSEKTSTKGAAKDSDVPTPAAAGPASVLVTGGTGALGSRTISRLLESPSSQVGVIYCTARAADDVVARERIFKALEDRKCHGNRAAWSKRLRCFAHLGEEGSEGVQAVRDAPNLVVIHCAWTVNFALSLPSFEQDCIAPLKDLLELYQSSHSPKRFIFCSSLASILAGPAPHIESPSAAIEYAGTTGYGQSKWVAEQICARSSSCIVGEVVIARVGQLCGDTECGIWNETEAYPLLVRTAVEVGCLPDSGPSIDWLPVDIAASALVDIALADRPRTTTSTESRILHIATSPDVPRPSWKDFVHWLAQAPELDFKLVGKGEWLDAVRKAGARIRGRALINDIWTNLPEASEEPTVDTTQARAASSTLAAQTKTVDQTLCLKFVRAWRTSGFI